MRRLETWCLYDDFSDCYFVRMTAIGPMGGARDEARLYSTERAAMSEPAVYHALTFYKPRRLYPDDALQARVKV